MKRPWLMKMIFSLMVLSGFIFLPGASQGAGDTYKGDSEIYGAATTGYKPNVLFIVDKSGSMSDPPPNTPAEYEPLDTYGDSKFCTASIDDGSHRNTAYASLSDILNGTGGSLLIPPDLASIHSGSGGSPSAPKVKVGMNNARGIVPVTEPASVTFTGGGVPIFDSPQVLSSLSSGSGGGRPAAPVQSGWSGGVNSAVAAVAAIWNGNAPEFIRVANHDITGRITLGGSGLSGVSLALSGTLLSGGSFTTSGTTDASGNYVLTVTGRGTFTVTPTLSGYTFSPASITVNVNGSGDFPGNNFTATGAYSLSGTITDSQGFVLIGVTVTAVSGGTTYGSATTDVSGFYTISLPGGKTYTVTPVLSGLTFTPVTLSPAISSSNVTGVDFTGSYTISGNIKSSQGALMSGVTVTATSGASTFSAITDASGNYTLTGLSGGGTIYTVTPVLAGLAFTPASSPVTINTTSQTANFTAVTYAISGTIKASSGSALSGVTVTVTGGSISTTTTTNSSGQYTVSNLPGNGATYTVTPTLTNYGFTPVNRSITINSSNQTADFTGGTLHDIKGSISGAIKSGVTVTATGPNGTFTGISTSSGGYSIINVPDGSYTVTPAYTGYTFSPVNRSVTLSGSNDWGNDFTASASGGGGGGTTYQISGKITTSGGGGNNLSGVTVTITGGGSTYTDTTDNQGNYTISGLTGGGITYTVTPTKSGYTFTPVSSSVTISTSSQTANFTATASGGVVGSGSTCAKNNIYKYTANGGSKATYNTWGNLSNGIYTNCRDAYDALTGPSGIWVGPLNSTTGSCSPSDTAGSFFLGNWLNWAHQTVAPTSGTAPTKMDIAKKVVTDLMLTTKNVKMGLMTFYNDKGGRFVDVGAYTSYVDFTTTGSLNGTDNLHNLVAAVNSLQAKNMTPLGGTLYEAMLYFMGKTSWVQPSVSYAGKSPIEAGCQTNYVIVVTDGMSTSDNAMVTGVGGTGEFGVYCAAGDCDGDKASNANEMSILGIDAGSGSDYMDDVSWYMHNNNMIPAMSGSKVTTFTIGFALDPKSISDLQGIQLLTDTAANGGGTFVNVADAASLALTLSNILGSILQIDTSFVAPVVPVSPANRTYSGNSVYIGLFLPQSDGFWFGNLKKFGYVNKQVVDVTGMPATSLTGAINDTAKSYWSKVQDGGKVKEGGVGAALYDQGAKNRYLYTYLGSVPGAITTAANAFTTGNANLTPALLGFSTGPALTDAANLTNIVDYVSGYPKSGSAKREWVMGDVLHSEPVVVNYGSNLSVIYLGGNEGMLHAFVDANPDNCGTPVNKTCIPDAVPPLPTLPSGVTDGGELWGFIPPEVLPNLQNLLGTNHGYGIDGSPAVYNYDANGNGAISPTDCVTTAGVTTCDQVILVFGERRGGRSYWALDVTDPYNPTVLWHIDNTTTGFTDLGETFSKPQIVPVNVTIPPATTPSVTRVVFIGGGYDNVNEDLNIDPPYTYSNTAGRAIYAINLLTGGLVAKWDVNSTGGDQPLYSIPTDLTVVDANGNGVIDTVYGGDVHGQIWKYDVSSTDPSAWTAKIIFQSNPGNDATVGRKIFYPPDVAFDIGNTSLFFGTGDREHPLKSLLVVDRIYAINDKPAYTGIIKEGGITIPTSSASTPLLMDVTSNLTPTGIDAGWYIKLDTAVTGHLAGEKVLSAPLLLNKDVTYTSYAPLLHVTPPDLCTAVLGTGFVWSLNYKNGGAFFDYNKDGTTTLSDRSKSLGSGIPSGVVVTITSSGMAGLVGIGGGIEGVDLNIGASANQIYWHQPY
jgi:type IV pilus assembly protein PilY1